MGLKKISQDQIDIDALDFIILSQKIANYGKDLGKKIIAFHDCGLPHFSRLNSMDRRRVIQSLLVQVNLFEKAHGGRSGVGHLNRQMLWHALKVLELVPCSDLMCYVKDDYVIEIHWADTLVQAYHSFNFYEKSSYTIEELACLSWTELYDTDDITTNKILKLAEDVRKYKVKRTLDPGFKNYRVSENLSAFRYDVDISYDYVSPLFDRNGVPVAAVSLEKLEVASRWLSPREEEGLLLNHQREHLVSLSAE